MPTFRYRLTLGDETKETDLRSSNPQGWLLDAVRATFPEIASNRASELIRVKLQPIEGASEQWHAKLVCGANSLFISVVRI
jgi:hypothetical protein